jgi:signal transduction histidine kinase
VWQSVIQHNSYDVFFKGGNNPKYLASSVELKEIPLTLVAYGNQRVLEGNTYEKLAVFIAVNFMFVGMVLGLSIWLQKNHKSPLTNLIAMSKNLAQKIFSFMTNLKNDELEDKLSQRNKELIANNEELEHHLSQRTKELIADNTQLEQTLSSLQTTQAQLIQAEKMASLGQMVAGIAHEVNNPVSFIYGNLAHVTEYVQNLLGLIHLYQQQYPQSNLEIEEEIEAIDLDFIRKDLPSILTSMKIGTKRISGIVHSLRTFSRLDEAEFKAADINESIESAIMVLRHRFQGREGYPEIMVIQDCGDLPLVYGYASLLNQVFMNLIINAIDAVEERLLQSKSTESEIAFVPLIEIRTEVTDQGWVAIYIIDNGGGIEEKVRSKIFDPFFTTKPIGKGAGLGLSVCYQIIVDKHGGKIECHSTPGEGTEFSIMIPVGSPVSFDKV